MKFYGLHEGFYEGVQTRIDLLRAACGERGVEYVDVDSLTFDYTQIPKLGRKDLLYALSSGSQTLMSLLLNDEVTTFYKKNPELNLITSTTEWTILHEKKGLTAPRTIFSLTADRTLLSRYVDYLGGFPLILKSVGGTRGIGTIKIESWHSLLSTADFLMSCGTNFILREFIVAKFGVRAIVLGGDVIRSARFYFPKNDFRNAAILSETRYELHELDSPAQSLCIESVNEINLEMGGVDLLFDEANRFYLLEVNFPTGFHAFSSIGVDVAGALLDHLIQKACR
jgi:hypothetical protein